VVVVTTPDPHQSVVVVAVVVEYDDDKLLYSHTVSAAVLFAVRHRAGFVQSRQQAAAGSPAVSK